MVVAQLGARDHYGFARAFHHAGKCDTLVTDFWWDSPFAPPGDIGRRIQSRFHPDLAGVKIEHVNIRSAAFEWNLRRSGSDSWTTICSRNEFFQRKALAVLEKLSSPAEGGYLFAYSYAARDLFRWAKRNGWKTILGQVDPGPKEDRLVQGLRENRPEFKDTRQTAPTSYYEEWREELELSDAIIVNSGWSASSLREEGVEDSRIHKVSIPYQTQIAPVRREAPSVFSKERPLRLLFLGQVNLRKGIAELLEAVEMLKGEPIELHLVGPLRVEIPTCFSDLESVSYHGAVPRSMIGSFLDKADLFVFPTHSDGFGLTQVEALASGLPVLSSLNCAQVVQDGVTGCIVEEVTASSIARAIREILKSPEILTKWSAACEVPATCDMGVVSKDLIEIINSL